MNDEQKTRSGLARYEQEVKTARDYFKDFKGFGTEGTYLGFERKDVAETARNVLESHRGELVRVSYNKINGPFYYQHRNKYNQSNIFEPVENWMTVPKAGSLESIFRDVNTDNMRLEFAGTTIEIQKIVIGEQFVSEICFRDK